MANTTIVMTVGSLAATGVDVEGGTGSRVTGDVTTEFTRKIKMLDTGDVTTVLRRALNKAWTLSSKHADLTTVYRNSV
jgi:hypothetical protein